MFMLFLVVKFTLFICTSNVVVSALIFSFTVVLLLVIFILTMFDH